MTGLFPMACENKRIASGVAAALVAYSPRAQSILPLPAWAHVIGAAVAVDALCRGRDIMKGTEEAVTSAGIGVATAVAAHAMGVAKIY